MHDWFVLAHVVGAILFIGAHAVSMAAAFELRGIPDRDRAQAILKRSGIAIGVMYLGLLLLLVGGIGAAFTGGWWGSLWLWAAIVVLVFVIAAMYTMAAPHYGKLRTALGMKATGDEPAAPVDEAEVRALMASPVPYQLALVGGIGLALILWLMLAKPF